jgi:RNA polymerase sigma-70 factor (ECF subfamily)
MDRAWIAREFEERRPHLRAVAYRMLGSLSEADDAVQETWLRVSKAGADGVENLGGWLTTIVGRVCLNMLRARTSRREEPIDEAYVPDPVVTGEDAAGPEHEAVLADSVGLALLVVLEMLPPAERLAFVLHDMFAVPFDDIAPIIGRSPEAARQLASRARRRVQGAAPMPDRDVARQRAVVDAFFAAARGGDFEALVAVLAPDAVLRSDVGPGNRLTRVVRGAEAVARQALMFSGAGRVLHPVLVNGMAGVLVTAGGQPVSVMGFTVIEGRIVAIDALADRERITGLDVARFAR